jgi:hypothetical protein
MLRRFALSILMLLSVVAILPFADSAARGIQQSVSMHRRHHRHHSRRWWRRHRALVRRRHAAAMAHRNAPLAMKPAGTAPNASAVSTAALPELPAGWNTSAVTPNGEMKFRSSGNGSDKAALSVVALSRPASGYLTSKEQRQILGGVSFTELRRTVIDKMIAAGGWVSNDYEREVAGRRVFVVTAQTPADGRQPDKALNFYFTEVNGRIYSLSTEANVQSAERMAAEAERFISTLH